MPGAGDIRAGAAYVELALKDTLSRGLDSAGAKVRAFGQSITALGGTALAGAAVAATGLLAVVQRFTSEAVKIEVVAARLGASAEAVSELGYAAELAGASLEDVEAAARTMGKFVTDAAGGSESAAEALASLGLHARQLFGLKPDQQFELVADALQRINDPARRANVLMGLLGDGGAKLAPILGKGAEGLRAVREEAKQLGASVSTDQAKAAKDLSDGWLKLTKVFQGAVNVVGEAVAPMLNDLLGTVRGHSVAAKEWLAANSGLIVSAVKLIPVVAAAGAGLVALGLTVSTLGVGLGIAAKAVAVLGAGIGFLFSPIGLVTAAVAGLTTAWAMLTPEGQKAASEVGEAWSDVGSDIKGAWGAIVDNLKGGDLENAARIGALALQVEFEKVIASLGKSWEAFTRGLATTFDRPSSALRALARATGQGYYDSGARNFGERLSGIHNALSAPVFGGTTATLTRYSDEQVGLINGARAIPGMLPGSEGGAGMLARAASTLLDAGQSIAEGLKPLTAAQQRLQDLRDKLAEATSTRRGADAFLPGRLMDELRKAPATVAGMSDTLTLQGSRGTFNASRAAQSLGQSDQAKKQIEAIDGVKNEVEALKDVVKKAAMIE